MPRKRTQSAIDKAWRELDEMTAKWDAEDTDNLDDLYNEIYGDPPTPPADDAQYGGCQQLHAWRQERG